jgi:hypothetical protein
MVDETLPNITNTKLITNEDPVTDTTTSSTPSPLKSPPSLTAIPPGALYELVIVNPFFTFKLFAR